MVLSRFIRTARAPCAPGKSSGGRTRRSQNRGKSKGNWKCLQDSEVAQLKQWLHQLGLTPDPHHHAPSCKDGDDICVLEKLDDLGVPVDKIAKDRLRPKAPRSWAKKPSTWLTTTEFDRVMKQYETAYPEFEFLGASPIDFDKPMGQSCVWPRICKFSLAKAKRAGKTKIGMVFNEDNHDQPGSHWVCTFLDIPRGRLYYIDSVGHPMPDEVRVFVDRLREEYAELHGGQLRVDESRVPHQRGDNQCGMYCLFFIIALLTETATYEELMEDRIPGGMMAELRKVLFRTSEADSKSGLSTTKRQDGGRKRRNTRHGRRGRGCKRRGTKRKVTQRRR